MKTLTTHASQTFIRGASTRPGVLLAALFALVLSSGVSVQATTYNWISANSDGYTNQADWTPTGLPGILDTAIIGNATQPNGSVVYTNLPPDPASTNNIYLLEMGTAAGMSTFTMTGGVLLVTNGTAGVSGSGGTAFSLGTASGAADTFIQDGGTFVVARPGTGPLYYQDAAIIGANAAGIGNYTINNGTAYFLCGVEMGDPGTGTFSVNGGTVVDNGWFGLRGNSATTNSAIFNLTGGTLYILRNADTDGSGARTGVAFTQVGYDGVANISGGTLYCEQIQFNSSGSIPTNTLNISGGAIYVSFLGVWLDGSLSSLVPSINISGGTFHTVCMAQVNSAATIGNTNTISTVGTNWAWNINMPVNLTNSTFLVNGTAGPGYVTFAPETNQTITLSNVWSGVGGMAMNGPGTLLMPSATNQIQFTGPLTVNGGTFTANGTNTIGAVNLAGGTLTLNGANTINGAVNLTGGTMALNGANTINSAVTITGGTAALNAANIINGAVNVSGGTLELNAAQDDIGGVAVNGGTLQFDTGGSVIDPTITVASGGTIDFNGSGSTPFANNITGAGNVLVTQAASTSAVNATGNLTYSGSTLISQGIFQVTGLPNTSGVIVTNTGTLASSGVIHAPITVGTNASLFVGTTGQAGTLNASNVILNNGSTFYVKIGTATTPGGGTNDLLVCTNLTLGADSIMSIDPIQTPLSIGTYIIVKYSGTLTGIFGKLNGPSGMSLNYSIPGEIQLVVTSITPANLTWAALIGAADLNWDVNTSSNWINTATSSLDTFHQLDDVTFNSAPGTTNQVNVSAAVTPTSVTISGGFNYRFNGPGYISGSASITDNGTGTNVIGTSGNNYTGPVQVNSGVLQLGIGGSSWLGATNSGTTVASGGTLDLNGQAVGLEGITISGTGSSGQGALYNSYTVSATLQNLSLGNNATIGSGGNIAVNDTTGGQVQGNGFALTEIGSGTLQFNNTDAQGYGSGNGLGNINIQGGLFSLQGFSSLGNPAGNLTVQGATVSFNAVTNLGDAVHGGLNKNLVLNNGVVDSAGTSNNFIGPVSLAGSGNTIGLRSDLYLWSSISGSGSVTIGPDALGAGGGTLWLEGTNTYNGSTLLTAGRIVLGTNASIQNSSLIQLNAGTTLDASRAGGLNLNSGQTLGGFGTVISNVTAGAGTAISPGNSVTAGTLMLTNNLTLNGDTNIIKLSGDPTQTGGANDLVSVGGALTLTGNSTIEVVPIGALSSSQPYIVMQGGSLTGGAGNLTAISASPRYSVSAATSGNTVEINASGSPAELKWYGNMPGQVGIWASGTTNWINLGTSQYDAFYDGDNPIFDDSSSVTSVTIPNGVVPSGIYMSNVANTYTFSGSGGIGGTLNMEGNGNGAGGTLVLAMSNAPPSFTGIDSSAGTLVYDLQGVTNYTVAANITDNLGNGNGNIVFGGTNTAILEGNNAYDAFGDHPAFYGAFWVTNGILEYTNVDALGADASVSGSPSFSPLIVTNNGTLNFNGVPAGTSDTAGIGGEKWIHISGSGYNGHGALTDSQANQDPGGGAFCYLYLDTNATIGSVTNVRYDQHVLSGNAQQVEGNGFNLTFIGSGYCTFYGQSDGDTHFGNIDVASTLPGRLLFQSGPLALGNPTNYLLVETNAEVTFYAVSNELDPLHYGINKILWLKGSAIATGSTNNFTAPEFDSAGASNNYIGPVFLSGTSLFGTRSDLHFWNTIMDSNGPGGFILGNDSVGASGSTLWLDGTNSYSGPTIVSNKTLYVGANSSLGMSTYVQVNSGATLNLSATPGYNFGTVATNQTMAGNGTVVGPAGGSLNFNAGGALAVGLPSGIGLPITNASTLTISGSVVFNAGSTNYIAANKTNSSAGTVSVGKVSGLTSLTLGGTLVITNYGANFVAGDSLPLFSATTIATNTYTIVPATPGPNLAWNINSLPVNGTLGVVSTLTVNPNPTNIVFSVTGGNLTLTWPLDHTGWQLQVQTNTLAVGIKTNWVNVSGSTTTNQVIVPINLTNGCVFYRLTY